MFYAPICLIIQFIHYCKEVAMNRWLQFSVLMVIALVAFATPRTAFAQDPVTFQVSMAVKMCEGTFNAGSEFVTVAGDINGWSTSADTLTDGDGDSVYVKTINVSGGAATYKFFTTGGLGWEGDPNRTYTVPSGGGTIPVDFFNRDNACNPPGGNVDVIFQVSMAVKICEGTFNPATEVVTVPGDLNGWSTSADTLTDGNGDSIYTTTKSLAEGTTVNYKFWTSGGLGWEGDPNRSYVIPVGGGTVPVDFFNRDDACSQTVNADVLWHSDFTAYQQLGWFNPAIDTVQIRGAFNGWGGSVMDFNSLTTGTYEALVNGTFSLNEAIGHKYFIDLDDATAETRFPGYSGDQDGVRYDHPYTGGDGNRSFVIPGGGQLETPLNWFSDINPQGLLLNTTDSVTVTLHVNMAPAVNDGIPFDPSADSVYIIFVDKMWKGAQAANRGGSAAAFADVKLTATSDPSDTVYEGSFTVIGKAHYGIMYVYEFRTNSGSTSQEGAGLGAPNGRRVRYIQPLAPNSFPRNYTAPLDEWKKNAPLNVETPPYNPSAGVSQDPTPSVPAGFKLGQNYPNPFNPATKMKYTVPERAHVTLKVYNLLGQVVATLVDQTQSAGNYIATFEANNLTTGVYFYRLEAGKFTETRKMVLLK